MTWEAYPGGELLADGLRAYATGVVTDGSLLVSIVRARLRWHGLAMEERVPALEHAHERLYARLAERSGDGAHSAYNALIRRATSFCAALDSARAPRDL